MHIIVSLCMNFFRTGLHITAFTFELHYRVFSEGSGETASLGNLDSYLSRLSGVLEGNPHKHRALVGQLCEVLSHLDRSVISA